MTIKEVELQVGITRANMRFYEKEGLLAPVRGSNNYREYSQEDVECLKKIRILRMMGLSVADIRLFMDGKCDLSALLNQRIWDIEKEVEELARVKDLCCEIRDREWEFGTLDPGFLDLRLQELKKTGGILMKGDRIDRWCRIRDWAFMFCFLCIFSMVMFPLNQLLGVKVPEKVLAVWTTIISLSPFPALILWSVTAPRARWEVPDMNRMLMDSGNILKKVERDKGSGYGKAERFNQLCLLSLLVLPINRILGISLPAWVLGSWMAVVVGSVIVLMVMKNRQ